MRALYRTAWWSATVVLGVVGLAGGWLVLGGGAALLVAAISGTLSASAAAACPTARPTRPALPRPLVCAVVGAALLPALVGLVTELGAAGLGLFLLVAATGWPVLRPAAPGPSPTGRRHVTPIPPGEKIPADRLPAATALPSMSTSDVCLLWRLGYVRLQHPVWWGEREHVAQLRRSCLDELERRDPATFRRWLPTARAAADPARAFCPREQSDHRIGPGSPAGQ